MALNFNKAEFVLSAAAPTSFLRDGRPQVTFAGRSNVGKSSVINRILSRKNFARVGATPGKTTQINYFRIDDKIYFTDLPGYGYAKVSHDEKIRWAELMEGYFQSGRNILLVIQLVDMRHPATEQDIDMMRFMKSAGIPFIVVMTKCDKLNKTETAKRLSEIKEELAEFEGVKTIPFSATKGTGADEIRKEIEKSL